MINLIPPQGHTALTHEYVLRVWTVYAAILAGVCAAGAALLIPTYVLVSAQLNVVAVDNARTTEVEGEFARVEEDIAHANTIITQLMENTSDVRISEVIEEVVSHGGQGITFTTFQAVEEKGTLKEIAIQGIASSRGTLSSLKTSLEASPYFTRVELPLSDLARDANLPFAITLTLADKTVLQEL